MGAMTPTVRANVKAWECDVMEHMNVQYYLARSTETIGQLQVMLGLSAHPRLALIHQAERVLFMSLLFIKRMRNGESYTVYSGILSMTDDTLTTFSEINNLDNETIAARFIIDLQLTDLDSGQAASFPKGAHLAAQAITIEPPTNLRAKQTLPQPQQHNLSTAEHYGLFDTARGTIEPWECDARGNLHPRFFMSRCSDTVPVAICTPASLCRAAPILSPTCNATTA